MRIMVPLFPLLFRRPLRRSHRRPAPSVLAIWALLSASAGHLAATEATANGEASARPSMEPCRLCKGPLPCLPQGIKPSSRIKVLDPAKMQITLGVTIGIDGTETDCFVQIQTPTMTGSKWLNVSTAGQEARTNCWYAKKSTWFASNQQVFINYAGNCSSAEEMVGRHRIRFAGGEEVAAFVAVYPTTDYDVRAEREDVCSATATDLGGKTNASCVSLPRGEGINFKRCRAVGGVAELETCDGKRMLLTDKVKVVRVSGRTTLLLPIKCDKNLTVHCSLPGLNEVVSSLEISVANKTAKEEANIELTSGYHVATAAITSTTAIAVGILAVVLVLFLIIFTIVKRRRIYRVDNANLPIYDGPRIKLPDSPAKSETLSGHKSQRQQSQNHHHFGIRPRLESVLSATLSFFTSSSSAGSSSKSRCSSGSSENEENLHLMPLDFPTWMKDRLFSMDSIKIRSELGHGHYGVVYHAHVVDGTARWPVAVKCTKAAPEDFSDMPIMPANEELLSGNQELIKEGEVMATLPYHENIANLQGLALDRSSREPRILLMIEYCGNGSLHRYILANKSEFAKELRRCRYVKGGREGENVTKGISLLIAWGHQVARGMEFLSNRAIVHGDLATRNVLLTDDLNAKISDFGLSHRLQNREKSAELRQTHLPERWMAPEAIVQRRVTTECDVWSFGILLWELFSLGQLPYKDLLVNSSVGFLDAVQSGVRPSCPDCCPSDIYEVMTSCWTLDPQDRQVFAELSSRLGAFMDPGYTHRYQEAREEMLRRYSRIQQNRIYFNVEPDSIPRPAAESAGYCVMAPSSTASGTTADTLLSVVNAEPDRTVGNRRATDDTGYCVMNGVS